jgi:hypothetical protein
MGIGAIMIFNGSVVFFLGMLFGFPYGRKLVSKRSSKEEIEAWKVAHSSVSNGGVGLIAIGAAVIVLSLDTSLTQLMGYLWIVSFYAFTVGVLLAALWKERGLRYGGKFKNRLVFFSYAIAVISSLVAGGLLIYLSYSSL